MKRRVFSVHLTNNNRYFSFCLNIFFRPVSYCPLHNPPPCPATVTRSVKKFFFSSLYLSFSIFFLCSRVSLISSQGIPPMRARGGSLPTQVITGCLRKNCHHIIDPLFLEHPVLITQVLPPVSGQTPSSSTRTRTLAQAMEASHWLIQY